jgi:hypothetical protein
MNWSKALITELAARRCIVFLGAGASAGSLSQDGQKNPPTWGQFLERLINILPSKNNESVIRGYMAKEKYLEAAEIMYHDMPKAEFSRFVREQLDMPRYNASRVHEAVLNLDPKIVITTNYDTIYENYCREGAAVEGYHVAKYYETHLMADLRSPVRMIIKAHGCVTDPAQIVLTKSQYFSARQRYSNFYKILDSLFLTNTILFIGYNLNDPDIQLILENVNITAPSPHPHYFVTGNNLNEIIKKANKSAYNLELIEFTKGDYDELYDGLDQLVEEVNQLRSINPSI